MSNVNCPFCGDRGLKTKEHVWGQWLHETPGAKALLDGTHGERVPRTFSFIRKDEDGHYRRVDASGGYGAKWLPNVTVPVCEACNTKWMSALEDQAKAIVGPFIFDRIPVRLSAHDLRSLTTWGTTSWMAYALTRHP